MRKTISLLLIASCTALASQDAGNWDGKWVADECWEHSSGSLSNCIEYTLDIATSQPNAKSTLSIQGYMISLDAVVDVRPLNDGFQILMMSSESEPVGVHFSAGEILFELHAAPSGFSTKWQALSPVLETTRFSKE